MNKQNWIELIHSRSAKDPVRLPADAAPRLKKLSGIRAVVFDVYGTLISSGVGDISLATEQDRDVSLKKTLIDNQITLNEEATVVAFDKLLHVQIKAAQSERAGQGITYPEVEIREVWKSFITQLEVEHLISDSESADINTLIIDYESRINPTQAMPGLAETLNELNQRRLPSSIISNAQFYTPLLFDTFLGSDIDTLGFCPQCSVWSYKEREGKPSTHLYKIAAERLKEHHGIETSEVLYIGNDLRNDIWPAQLIGFKTALFAGDALSLRRRPNDPNCEHVKADIELTDLRQIFECI
jgi:putative hydrolase of the HAD superfamily